jgi:hypothetical protein
MLRLHIFRQSWPNDVERKMRLHVFTLNLNNNPSPLLPPSQCRLGLFSARNKHNTSSFINATINIGRGSGAREFLFRKTCEDIITRAPLPIN